MVFNFDFFKFTGVDPTTFTMKDLRNFLEDKETKRLCYALSEQKLKLHDDHSGNDVKKWLNLPFRKSIAPIINSICGITVYDKKTDSGCCYPCKTDAEIAAIEKFASDYQDVVFIRDNMELSIALSMNKYQPNGDHTRIGKLEYQAKWKEEERTAAVTELTAEMQRILDAFPYFKMADYIAAIPSNHPFVRDIISGLTGFKFQDVSGTLSWTSKTDEVKEAEGNDKIDLLESFGFTITDGLDLNDKNILLVDDLYNSGLTMQYVALKLKEAGAKRVFGICLVKSCSNT